MILFSKKSFVVRYIPIFLGLYLLVLTLTFILVFQQEKRIIRDAIAINCSFLDGQEDLLHSIIVPAVSDISFLANQKSVQKYVPEEFGKEQLLGDMINITQSHKDIFQAIYFDPIGNETMRINCKGDTLEIEKQERLQNKSDHPYFIKSKELKKGDVYISPIELYKENGQVSTPYQRVIRYGTAIYNEKGFVKGVLIINQSLNEMFLKMKKTIAPNSSNLILINKSGYWLVNTSNSNEFRFMFDSLKDGHTFNNLYPKVWSQIKDQDIGYYETAKELFVVKDASLVTDINFINTHKGSKVIIDNENEWKFILVTKKGDINDLVMLKQFFILSTIILFFIVAAVTYAFFSLRFSEKEHVRGLNELNQELEAKIKKRTVQLEIKNSELNSLNKELEAFTYSVSHDLRAPLRQIVGFADLVIMQKNVKMGKKTMYYLENIKEASEDMSKLIENLLNLSRIGRLELKRDSFDLSRMVVESQKLIEDEFEKRIIKWSVPELPWITADYGLFKQVWFNLFHNAVKYSGKKPQSNIRVGCITNEDEYVFSVEDNGIGFDMNYVGELFKPFHRLHSKEEFEGTGIGLANVKRIIIRHGGNIWAESNGEGASFYFTVPRH